MGSNIASAIVKTWTLAKTWCPNFVQAQEMRSINDSIGTALEENSRRNEELAALRARVAELEEGISTAMQLIEGGFDSAAYEALEALNAHK